MNLRLSRWKCWTTISLCTHATPIDFQLSRMYYDLSSSLLLTSSSMMIVLGICFCGSTTAAIFCFVITVIRLIRSVLLFSSMLNEANHSHDSRLDGLREFGVSPWISVRQLVLMFRYFFSDDVCVFHIYRNYIFDSHDSFAHSIIAFYTRFERKMWNRTIRVGWRARTRISNRFSIAFAFGREHQHQHQHIIESQTKRIFCSYLTFDGPSTIVHTRRTFIHDYTCDSDQSVHTKQTYETLTDVTTNIQYSILSLARSGSLFTVKIHSQNVTLTNITWKHT